MITQFKDRYRFLSNFWMAPVKYDGVDYCSVEHGYQAAKTLDEIWRDKIRAQMSPGMAKKIGKKVPVREDWDAIKLSVMEDLVRQKFTNSIVLRRWLLETGNQKLVEGNAWGDTFWGVYKGVGENHLGEILMKIRKELAS